MQRSCDSTITIEAIDRAVSDLRAGEHSIWQSRTGFRGLEYDSA